MAALEPFFTFEASIPPHRLAALSLAQIADHVEYWNERRSRADG